MYVFVMVYPYSDTGCSNTTTKLLTMHMGPDYCFIIPTRTVLVNIQHANGCAVGNLNTIKNHIKQNK